MLHAPWIHGWAAAGATALAGFVQSLNIFGHRYTLLTEKSPHVPRRLGLSGAAKKLYGWPPPETSRDTAWLDGLRGLAALIVFSSHFHQFLHIPYIEVPWGAREEYKWQIWRLPFLRLWTCGGHAQVSIFFVLSGFVLSWAPLQMIRQGQFERLVTSLGSATLRRWIRLYLPCFAVAFWACLMFWFDIRQIALKPRKDTLLEQLWDYVIANEKFANPFMIDRNGWNAQHGYESVMWTIPFEYSGSLLIFLLSLAVAKVQDYRRRTYAISIVALYALLRAQWNYWHFAAGMLISDYVRERGGFDALTEASTKTSRLRWFGVLILGLYLAGDPASDKKKYGRPGYHILEILTPDNWKRIEGGHRHWWSFAGVLIILSACHLARIRRFFAMPSLRYLGRISYMLYITHLTTMSHIMKPLYDYLYNHLGGLYLDEDKNIQLGASPLMEVFIYLVLWGIIGPTTILVAHWCEVCLDRPSQKLARKVNELFVNGSTQQTHPEGHVRLPD